MNFECNINVIIMLNNAFFRKMKDISLLFLFGGAWFGQCLENHQTTGKTKLLFTSTDHLACNLVEI